MDEPCQHDDVYWTLDSSQEKGWHCDNCRAHLGYRPDLDRAQTWDKVDVILHALHDADLTYVSNGTMGMLIVGAVEQRCHDENTYDQESIIRFILEHPDMDSREFWRYEAAHWLAKHEEGHEVEKQGGGL